MRAILLKDVPKLGKKGEIKNVSGGYLRNYLVPQGLAVLADEGSLRKNASEQAALYEKQTKEKAGLIELASRLKAIKLSTTLKMGGGRAAFGSVGASKIIELLAEKGIVLDKSVLELEKPIKTLGEHIIRVALGQGVVGELALEVQTKENRR